jgi:hypothetical protein
MHREPHGIEAPYAVVLGIGDPDSILGVDCDSFGSPHWITRGSFDGLHIPAAWFIDLNAIIARIRDGYKCWTDGHVVWFKQSVFIFAPASKSAEHTAVLVEEHDHMMPGVGNV